MSNESSSSMPVRAVTPVSLSRFKSDSLFATELFDNYVARLVRQHIVQQFVDFNHPVLVDEKKMINSSAIEIRSYLGCFIPECSTEWNLAKQIVIRHVWQMAEQRLAQHDIDDETRAIAINSIYKEDFKELFPNWFD